MSEKDHEIKKTMQQFHKHGLNCGDEIAKVLKEMHPNALAIVPLYRSCIVIEQSEEEKKAGSCTIHAYGDPHWLGNDINEEMLKTNDIHFEYCIQGDRQRPIIMEKNSDNSIEDKYEHDEN